MQQYILCFGLRLDMVWIPVLLGHMRFPWQLSATRCETMAVFPKPRLPVITTPLLVFGSSMRRWASISWKSHSLPVNSQSDGRPGISNWSGFRLIDGVKCTAGKKRVALSYVTLEKLSLSVKPQSECCRIAEISMSEMFKKKSSWISGDTMSKRMDKKSRKLLKESGDWKNVYIQVCKDTSKLWLSKCLGMMVMVGFNRKKKKQTSVCFFSCFFKRQ